MDWEVAGQDNSDAGSSASPKPPKRKGKKLKKWVVVIAVIAAIVVYSNIKSCINNQPKNLSWPTTGLATMLPDPPTNKGEVNTDSDRSFSADVEKCSEDQYKAYVESCKEKGFTVDAESNTSSYEAYNSDGYKLRLSYWSSSEKLSVYLDAATEMGTLTWPAAGAGSLAPAPTSKKGKVSSDSSTYFAALVGDTDSAAYGAYVDSCISAGFNVDYHKGDTLFYADNANGDHISVSYEGFNTMKVIVDAADVSASAETTSSDSSASAKVEAETKTEEAPAATSDSASSESSSASAGDFRQFVDDYESFMNSYCDFMEKYKSSSNTASMMVDYAKMVKDYAEWAEKFDGYDTGELGADDLAYYTAAQARVLERLSKIQ